MKDGSGRIDAGSYQPVEKLAGRRVGARGLQDLLGIRYALQARCPHRACFSTACYGRATRTRSFGKLLLVRLTGSERNLAAVCATGPGQIAKSLYSGLTSSMGGSSMPAATVAFVLGSIRMNEPVNRLVA